MVHGYIILDLCIISALIIPPIIWLSYGSYGFAEDEDVEEQANLINQSDTKQRDEADAKDAGISCQQREEDNELSGGSEKVVEKMAEAAPAASAAPAPASDESIKRKENIEQKQAPQNESGSSKESLVNSSDSTTAAQSPALIGDELVRIIVKEDSPALADDCRSPSTICGGRPLATSRTEILQFLSGYRGI